MPRYHPSREEFERLASEYPVVPVWREVIADLETPVSAFSKLASSSSEAAHAFLLESVEGGERWGRYSFIGVDPFLVMVCRDGIVSWEGTPPAAAVAMPISMANSAAGKTSRFNSRVSFGNIWSGSL